MQQYDNYVSDSNMDFIKNILILNGIVFTEMQSQIFFEYNNVKWNVDITAGDTVHLINTNNGSVMSFQSSKDFALHFLASKDNVKFF